MTTVVTIGLVLLGAWLLRGRDDSSSATRPVTSAPAQAPSAGATPARGAPAETTRHDAERYDLAADEARGGHTLARHVGRTDAQLRERLDNDRGISTASSYATQALAERTVARALRDHDDRVQAWVARRGNRPNLEVEYRGPRGDVIGRSVRRGREAVDCTDALVVLRWSGRDYYVLTTYPEASR